MYNDLKNILKYQTFHSQIRTVVMVNECITFFGKREVRVRSALDVSKRNNGLMTLCYIWVRSVYVVPNLTMD